MKTGSQILREAAEEMGYMAESVSSFFFGTKVQNNPLCKVKMQEKLQLVEKNCPFLIEFTLRVLLFAINVKFWQRWPKRPSHFGTVTGKRCRAG